MPSTHFRYKLHLYWYQILVVFFCLGSFSSQAQFSLQKTRKNADIYKIINLPNYDDKLLHYGFFVALNYNRFIMTASDYYINNPDLLTMKTSGQGGFALGFLVNFRLADQWAFRILPSVGFYDRYVEFTYSPQFVASQLSKPLLTQKLESTYLELQFLAKFRSQRRKNTRMYFVGGFKPGINAAGKKEDNNQTLRFNSFDLTVEYGVGFDLYFPLFKFAPELRFSHGLSNLLNPTNIPQSRAIDRLSTHTVTFYFFFE